MTNGEGPYFEEADTLRFIETLAGQSSLVIYAGAGVSIDRTNTTWRELIESLMAKHVPDDRVRKTLLSDSPLQSASMVKQMYIDRATLPTRGGARLDRRLMNQRIADDVRSCLYSAKDRELRRAGIARAVVELVADLKHRGAKSYVITTNYDDCLQQEIGLLRAKRGAPQLQRLAHTPKALDQRNGHQVKPAEIDEEVKKAIALAETRIVHLHGYVPETGG